jgi:hypothetical protein
MTVDTRIIRSVRRLIHRDTRRAARIVERLTTAEREAMLPALSPGERARLEATVGPLAQRPMI